MNGETAAWGLAEHLLAAAVDALNAANWQRAGDKNATRPKPIPRPGDERRLNRDELAERLRDFRRRHATRG